MTLEKLFKQRKPGASPRGEDKPMGTGCSVGTQSAHAMWQPPPHPFLFALCPQAALPATAAQ
ncbi:unnamed protein product, partial [Bubo scandiacus]